MILNRKRINLVVFVGMIVLIPRRQHAAKDNLERKLVTTNKWQEDDDAFSLEKQRQNTETSEREKRVMRRAANQTRLVRAQGATHQGSCLNRCSGERIVFKHGFDCYCDHACFETFFDCCPDYRRYCGRQIKMTRNHSTYSPSWTCAKIKKLGFGEGCSVLDVHGVWLIHECSPQWPADETKFKCENTSHSAEISYPFENYLPVVGENSLTYRNKYCAICNGIKRFVSWHLRLHTYVTPPETIASLDDKLKFTLQNGGNINIIGPKGDQPVRYCVIENDKGCENMWHHAYRDCVNGPVEVVATRDNGYVKNRDCGLCQGYAVEFAAWTFGVVCAPPGDGFSMVFYVNSRDSKSSSEVVKKTCPSGLVYDKNFQFCRQGYVISALDLVSNQFFMALWLVKSWISVSDEQELKRDFPRVVGDTFALKPAQISAMRFDRQNFDKKIIVASFRVMLMPLESLERDAQANGTRSKFLRIPNTIGNLTLQFENSSWLVIKVITKQLACVGERTFSLSEHTVSEDNGEMYHSKTGKAFALKNYTIIGRTAKNITICPQLLFSDCSEGAYVRLLRHEYVILRDLSLYHNATNKTFAYGEYYLSDEHDDVPKETGHSAGNSTVFACLPSTRHFLELRRKKDPSKYDYAVRVLTVCGFSISLLSLTIFLITYSLFSELRTIPGKNMMNLSVSLLLVQSFWLVRSAQETETILCSMVAVLEHYFILVSFVAMSVISYHSCVVFSSHSIASKPTKAEENRAFMKYFIIVWLPAALFIGFCITLDKTKTLIIDYNTLCWLGTRNSRIYLFLLPIGLSLVFNISAFTRTTKFLFEHKKETAKLQAKRKQNLSICIKLSTLTGFPWIFGFLGSAFEGVVAFEFIFVVLVCLQGFYIAVAFLCNSRVLKLYKKKRLEHLSKTSISTAVALSSANSKTTGI